MTDKGTKTKSSRKINYKGKFAIIKDDVKLEDQLTQVHNYPYKIIEQNKNKTWILLETFVQCTCATVAGATHEQINRSFWMKVKDCIIIDKN